MAGLDFYDAGALRQIATNLFYGWGYNFYKRENQLRADDQLVREKAGWLLGNAAVSVESAESNYRREFLPAPTREKPFPDAVAVAAAQQLERLAKAIRALASRMTELPTPENDRMTQRFREEAPTLAGLIALDEQLVGQCELLRSTVEKRDGAWIAERIKEISAGLDAIDATLMKRQGLLLNRIK
jgi:cell division septum initiation protein DivIVA